MTGSRTSFAERKHNFYLPCINRDIQYRERDRLPKTLSCKISEKTGREIKRSWGPIESNQTALRYNQCPTHLRGITADSYIIYLPKINLGRTPELTCVSLAEGGRSFSERKGTVAPALPRASSPFLRSITHRCRFSMSNPNRKSTSLLCRCETGHSKWGDVLPALRRLLSLHIKVSFFISISFGFSYSLQI